MPHDPGGPKRALFLAGLGAVAGLALAGWALFSAKGSVVGGMPPEDIALVNDRPVLRSDFVTQVQLEAGVAFDRTTADQRRAVLDEMINEELLVQRGLELDLAASDPDVRNALVAGVELQLNAAILAAEPGEGELEAYFVANKARYATEGIMQLRDFLLPAPSVPGAADQSSKAKEAAMALRGATQLDVVAAHFGLRDSKRLSMGDNFEFGVRAKLGDRLYEVAKSLAPGEVAEPVAQPDGIHVIVMIDRKPAVDSDFHSVRDAVRRDFQRDALARVEQENLAFLKGRARITLDPGVRQ